jgi:hypothetical protein
MFGATFYSGPIPDDQWQALMAAFGVRLDEAGRPLPPEPYETWDAYHVAVYQFCDQIKALPGVSRVTYDEETGLLTIYGLSDQTEWAGGVPELQRIIEAARKGEE